MKSIERGTYRMLIKNPSILVLFMLPILTFIISIGMQLLIKNRIAVVGVVFIAYLVATFVIFNSTFLIWCFIYTGIAIIGTLIADQIHLKRK